MTVGLIPADLLLAATMTVTRVVLVQPLEPSSSSSFVFSFFLGKGSATFTVDGV